MITKKKLALLVFFCVLFVTARASTAYASTDLSTLSGQNVTVDSYNYQDWIRGDNYVILFNPQNASGGGYVSRTTNSLATGFPVGSGNYTDILSSTPIGTVYYGSTLDLVWIYDTSGLRSAGALYTCASSYTVCNFASTLAGDEYVTAAGMTGASREVYSFATNSCLLNCAPPPPVFAPSRIISFTPVATSTATTSPTWVSVTYHIDTDHDGLLPVPTFEVQLQNLEGNIIPGLGSNVEHIRFTATTTPGTYTVGTSTPLSNGLYGLSVIPDTLLFENPAQGGLTGVQLEGHFVVGATAYPNNAYFATSTQTTITTGISACDSLSFPGNLSCYVGVMVKNVGIILFSPDPSTLAAFGDLNTQAQGRLPFVYAYQTANIVQTMFTASSTASTTLTVPLWKMGNSATSTITLISSSMIAAVPFSGTIYTILTALIWFSMVMYIYERVIRMHDVSTPK